MENSGNYYTLLGFLSLTGMLSDIILGWIQIFRMFEYDLLMELPLHTLFM